MTVERKYGVPGFRPYRPEPTYKLAAPTTVTHVERKTISIPIRDQLDEGCCTGFGWTRAIQRALKLADPLSPQFSYFLGRVREATEDVDAGAMVGDVGDAMLEYGAARELVYPYITKAFAQRPTLDAFTDALPLKGKVKFERVHGSAQFKHALATNPDAVIVFGFSVPAYFESEQMATTGWLRLPGSRDQFIGGHCVVADGYDTRLIDTPEGFVWVANSWNSDWGPYGGWFKLPLRWLDDPRRLVDEAYAVMPA